MKIIFLFNLVSSTCRYEETGITYYGTQATTRDGRTCQRWDSQTPHNHSETTVTSFHVLNLTESENYCRNPSPSDKFGPWCFGSDNDDVNGTWDYCDIPGCACK